MKRVLVIEDDRKVAELVRVCLEAEGFEVVVMSDGDTGLAQARKAPPDLLILDIELPKRSGLDVCRAVRQDERLRGAPVIMLTARVEEADRVIGLEVGADDYVCKPFSSRELAARVRAHLRRLEPSQKPSKPIQVGDLVIDPVSFVATLRGSAVPVTPLEFQLLYFLASHPNRVFSRDELLDAVWGKDRFVSPRSIDTYFWRLRERIEDNSKKPKYLETIRGVGYKFVTTEES